MMRTQPSVAAVLVASVLVFAWSPAGQAQEVSRVAMPGAQASNVFLKAAADLGLTVDTRADPEPEVCDALLLCAPAYPTVTPLSAEAQLCMERFLAAGKAVYVEYAPLAGLVGETLINAVFQRLLVTGTWLQQDGVPPLSILEEHASSYLLPVNVEGNVWLSYAHVAGVDHAVFGAPSVTVPALIERGQGAGRLLIATTALSNWERGRYRPTASWQAVLRAVLLGLLPEQKAAAVRDAYVDVQAWTEPRQWVAPGEAVRIQVRATPGSTVQVTGGTGAVELHTLTNGLFVSNLFTPEPGSLQWQVQANCGGALREVTLELVVSPRAQRYQETVERNLLWFERANMLFASDGSKGVREGFRSQVNPYGKPSVAGGLRVDCVSECGLAFRTYGLLTTNETWLQRGNRMLEYTARSFLCTSRDNWYFGQWQSRNEFRDDGSTLYVFNDDSGAGSFFSLLGYASTGDLEQLRTGLCGVEYFTHVASERTGLFSRMNHRDYQGSGRMGTPWPTMRAMDLSSDKPHKANLPQASLLAAYLLTGEPRYLEIAERAVRTLMTIYPNWPIQTSRTCEHSRMLLPLTLLLQAAPTAEHRAWLDTVVDYLADKQAPCGALIEWDGINPASNAAFGTGETSIFQQNGDPISDQLYNSGFAVFHLGLAYHLTGDERIGQIYRRLGDYLSRIQMADPDPLYDGTWLRAFDYGRWEYFGSSADIGWGPYCAETGWQCAPLIMGLMLGMTADTPGPVLSLPENPDAQLQPFAQAAWQEADAVETALLTGGASTSVWQCCDGTMEIRFPEYNRAETLIDFPALVVLNKGLSGFSYAGFLSPLGHDLRFSNATETVELDYEIETWNTNGTSHVWVRVPEFTSNTLIHAYWGSPGAAQQPACCTNGAVWSSNFRGVWHLTPELSDATAYANNGYHPNTATLDVAGPIGRARQTGIARNIAMNDPLQQLTLNNTFTYSFWSKAPYPMSSATAYVYQFKPQAGGQIGLLCNNNWVQFYVGNDYTNYTGTTHPGSVSSITVPDGDWHHYAYSYDGAKWIGCRDGQQMFGYDIDFALKPKSGTLNAYIGSSIAGDYFNGAVDELRVEDVGRSTNWIYACYLNQARAILQSTTIRFPEYDRAETLTNFPALVVLNKSLAGFSYDTVCSANGYDLHFRDSAGTRDLDHEIESWNPGGNSYVWVRVPEFTPNAMIRAYWGNLADKVVPASCTNGAVWPEPFRGVWHLSPDLIDSTPYRNNATAAGTADLRGPVGASARRTALNASIKLTNPDPLALSNVFTFSFWVKASFPTAANMYLYQFQPAGAQTGILCGYVPNTIEFYTSGGTGSARSGSQITVPDNDWHHYAYMYDGSTWAGCRDGQTIFRTARVMTLAPKTVANNLRIGSSANSDYFRGGIDEFRVEAVARSTNWIYACYRNQHVRRAECDYLNYPVFGARGTVTDVGSVSAKAGAYLSCRYPAVVRLFYGTVDGGEDAEGWDSSRYFGTVSTGNVAAKLTGLLPDQNYVYRCLASNALGVAWSDAFTFRTAPDASLSQYAFKMRFDFAGYTAEETLTNFPVAIVLSEQLAGFTYEPFASASGHDLRFTDANGQQLKYQIETWDSAGESTVWVQMPEFRKNSHVWAYWGNKDVVDQPAYCANGDVWDPSFRGVYHLTPALKDVTFGANHVVSNALTETIGGKVSYARSFANSANLLLGTSGSLGVSDAFTYSVWAKTPYPCTSSMYLYCRQPVGQSARHHGLVCGVKANQVEFSATGCGGTSNLCNASGLTIPDDGWHQYVYAFDGTNWAGYCDGEPVFSREGFFSSLAFTDEFTANQARIGADILLSQPFVGSLDELRVERVGRTANWIKASYANQNTPETFSVCGGVVSLRGTVLMLK